MPEFEPPNRVPLNAEARAVEMNIRREMAKGRQIFGPYAMCHPSGMPYILTMSGYGGYEAVISDREIDFFAGNQREVRRIFTDGRAHPRRAYHRPALQRRVRRALGGPHDGGGDH